MSLQFYIDPLVFWVEGYALECDVAGGNYEDGCGQRFDTFCTTFAVMSPTMLPGCSPSPTSK